MSTLPLVSSLHPLHHDSTSQLEPKPSHWCLIIFSLMILTLRLIQILNPHSKPTLQEWQLAMLSKVCPVPSDYDCVADICIVNSCVSFSVSVGHRDMSHLPDIPHWPIRGQVWPCLTNQRPSVTSHHQTSLRPGDTPILASQCRVASVTSMSRHVTKNV